MDTAHWIALYILACWPLVLAGIIGFVYWDKK
jgi:hypothetical protein